MFSGVQHDVFANYQSEWDMLIHVAPSNAPYVFITIKLASCHLLLYVVYMYQKYC